ncbi:MAG TPA: zf-HC2 domain-containing protein, partial [Vicinamibacterales bacterium]|nr:zf-HC2 domain-containing protein [Vicinamibacterales bacterium]
MKHTLGDCPDLETLAAFLDGRLSKADRERIAGHVSECETCYFVFAEASQIRPPAKSSWRAAFERLRRWMSVPVVVWSSSGAALATAALLWFATGPGWLLRSVPSSELVALVAAVGTDRTIEPRLTGGFQYGPMHGTVRGGESSPASPDVRIAAARIEKEAARGGNAQALRALGIASLVTGDVNRAVAVLEDAAQKSAPDATVLSDLAASYLVRGSRSGDAQDFTRALDAADRAIAMDARLLEAKFNRACALEHLSRVDDARRAWEDYL